jgi:hypothetical protein
MLVTNFFRLTFLRMRSFRALFVIALLILITGGGALGLSRLTPAHAATSTYTGNGVGFAIFISDTTAQSILVSETLTFGEHKVVCLMNPSATVPTVANGVSYLNPSVIDPLHWYRQLDPTVTMTTSLNAEIGTQATFYAYSTPACKYPASYSASFIAMVYTILPTSPISNTCWINMHTNKISGC